jgi:hypothetical protein
MPRQEACHGPSVTSSPAVSGPRQVPGNVTYISPATRTSLTNFPDPSSAQVLFCCHTPGPRRFLSISIPHGIFFPFQYPTALYFHHATHFFCFFSACRAWECSEEAAERRRWQRRRWSAQSMLLLALFFSFYQRLGGRSSDTLYREYFASSQRVVVSW